MDRQDRVRERIFSVRALRRVRHPLMLACAALLVRGADAFAVPRSLIGRDTPDAPSFFTLDFGAFGRPVGTITTTRIQLEVDADAGTARFVDYYQEVEAFELPGGFSTGDLIIRVQPGSSTGAYDARAGVFNTTEVYEIHFDPDHSDLAAFGFTESPVLFDSTSTGTITLSTAPSGTIKLDWAGESVLNNPFDPKGDPLEFSYTCDVTAAFQPSAATLVRLALIPDVLNLELSSAIENNLVSKLFRALDALDRRFQPRAVAYLRRFVDAVDAYAGRAVSDTDAENLRDAADDIISMLMERPRFSFR